VLLGSVLLDQHLHSLLAVRVLLVEVTGVLSLQSIVDALDDWVTLTRFIAVEVVKEQR
jgi:hypothetical protein